MSLIAILIALIVFGLVLYIVGLLPIDATVKRIIQAVAIVLLVIWLLLKLAPTLSTVI